MTRFLYQLVPGIEDKPYHNQPPDVREALAKYFDSGRLRHADTVMRDPVPRGPVTVVAVSEVEGFKNNEYLIAYEYRDYGVKVVDFWWVFPAQSTIADAAIRSHEYLEHMDRIFLA
jgi:hypothetical protein